jgi:hypothetical protein
MVAQMNTSAETKKRLVTFRMTGAEYQALREACTAGEWRSVSEFAHVAVTQRIRARSSSQVSLGEGLQTVCAKLEDIDAALSEASGLIRRALRPANG